MHERSNWDNVTLRDRLGRRKESEFDQLNLADIGPFYNVSPLAQT